VPSEAGWILVAVLAPTDAAAIAGLAKRMPRRTLTTLRAESLINDGTALVMFAVAVGALGGEATPSPPMLAGEFVWSFAGGILAGLATGSVVVLIRRHLDDPVREGGLSVLTPFVAFLLARVMQARPNPHAPTDRAHTHGHRSGMILQHSVIPFVPDCLIYSHICWRLDPLYRARTPQKLSAQ
jgi:hypothetical protein